MTLPVVWLPEADAELKHARAWYDNIRPELGSVSRSQLRRRLRQSQNTQCSFPSSIGDGGVRECGVFLTE